MFDYYNQNHATLSKIMYIQIWVYVVILLSYNRYENLFLLAIYRHKLCLIFNNIAIFLPAGCIIVICYASLSNTIAKI